MTGLFEVMRRRARRPGAGAVAAVLSLGAGCWAVGSAAATVRDVGALCAAGANMFACYDAFAWGLAWTCGLAFGSYLYGRFGAACLFGARLPWLLRPEAFARLAAIAGRACRDAAAVRDGEAAPEEATPGPTRFDVLEY